MPDDNVVSAQWRALLTGEDRSLQKIRRVWRHVPSAPRCKVCASPFHGIGGVAARSMWHGQMRDNPLLCKACFGAISKHPGGAEVDISIVFADVAAERSRWGSSLRAEASERGEGLRSLHA